MIRSSGSFPSQNRSACVHAGSSWPSPDALGGISCLRKDPVPLRCIMSRSWIAALASRASTVLLRKLTGALKKPRPDVACHLLLPAPQGFVGGDPLSPVARYLLSRLKQLADTTCPSPVRVFAVASEGRELWSVDDRQRVKPRDLVLERPGVVLVNASCLLDNS